MSRVSSELLLADPVDPIEVPGHRVLDRSCLHVVPDGATVSENGEVSLHGKVVATYPPCHYAVLNDMPKAPSGELGFDGWVEYTNLNVPDPGYHWSKISQSLTVPLPPTHVDSAIVIAFFNSFQPSDYSSIVQPVLQWGALTGLDGHQCGVVNGWSLTEWYVGSSGGTCSHAEQNSVHSGDTIQLSISDVAYRFGQSCVLENTLIETQDLTESTSGTLFAPWQDDTTVQSAVLEAHYVSTCDEFPASSSTFFSQPALYESIANGTCNSRGGDVWNGWTVNIPWASQPGMPQCGYNVTVGGWGDATLYY